MVKLFNSPNCDARPSDEEISLVVIHAISLPPDRFGGPGVAQLFTNQIDPTEHPYYAGIHHLRVSAHYFIRRTGELLCFVPPEMRAWHAGLSQWQGRERCNDFSIGIELEGCDTLPFEKAQYAALAELLARLCTDYPIEAIVGHSDVAPGRKTDPGPFFDWQYLRNQLLNSNHPECGNLIEAKQSGADTVSTFDAWPFPISRRPD